MNFMRFDGSVTTGQTSVILGVTQIAKPEIQDTVAPRPLVLGVRPEHILLSDSANYRGQIETVEYLGTTQIVTLAAAHGRLKARIPSGQVPKVGEVVGLNFTAPTLVVFDGTTGRAVRTAVNAGVHHG